MFAVVEDEQKLFRFEPFENALFEGGARTTLYPERRCDDLQHAVGILGGSKLAEPGTIPKPREHLRSDLHRQAGLANTANARERDQPRFAESPPENREFLGAAHK